MIDGRLLGFHCVRIALTIAFVGSAVSHARPAALAQDSANAARAGQITFTKDVAPILQRSCQNCHRPGAIAPMSLLTYDDARPWARSIR